MGSNTGGSMHGLIHLLYICTVVSAELISFEFSKASGFVQKKLGTSPTGSFIKMTFLLNFEKLEKHSKVTCGSVLKKRYV